MRQPNGDEGVLKQPRTQLNSDEPLDRSQICAVIVTYNIGEALHRCVDAIKDQVAHVLIVDNGSSEPTLRELEKLTLSNSIKLILNQRNEGLARAYNQAVQWALENKFRWLLTLDHDSIATPGMIEELIRGHEALRRAGIQNVGIIAASPFDQNAQRYLYGTPPRKEGGLPTFDEGVISSGSLILLRVFDVVGPFNEGLFVYHVDTEFCIRIARAGFAAYFCPEAVFIHQEGVKTQHKFLWRTAWYDHYGKKARYYIMRNTVILLKEFPEVRKYFGDVFRKYSMDHVKVLLFDKERLQIFWFSLRGLIDGLRGKIGPLDSE